MKVVFELKKVKGVTLILKYNLIYWPVPRQAFSCLKFGFLAELSGERRLIARTFPPKVSMEYSLLEAYNEYNFAL